MGSEHGHIGIIRYDKYSFIAKAAPNEHSMSKFIIAKIHF
ncbi:hypothetical protein KLQUMMO235M1_26180 [Klebsiella quasipneumoniae subsp. quasipneumoniae]